jgi:excisionase family DNA binding protein
MAESTVYKNAQKGKLPGWKIGGTWRFSRRAIDAHLQGQPTAAPAKEHA